jgi:hypothetical protein
MAEKQFSISRWGKGNVEILAAGHMEAAIMVSIEKEPENYPNELIDFMKALEISDPEKYARKKQKLREFLVTFQKKQEMLKRKKINS